MTFSHSLRTSCRRTPVWVMLLGTRQPRVAPTTSTHDKGAGIGIEDGTHRDLYRWKRSLRAPLVLRLCQHLGMCRDTTDRAGQPG